MIKRYLLSKNRAREVVIVFMLFIIVLLPFLIGIDKEIYHVDESLHISRGIKGISLIVHGDIGGDEWDYFYTNEGEVVHGAITPANVIMGLGPWLIGVKSGGWNWKVNPPDNVLKSARVMVAIQGAMTCVILFYIGRAVGSFETGLFASIFLAFNPLWLMNSRRAMRDTPMAFFSTISVLLFYYGLKKDNMKTKGSFLALSGVMTGLAIGSKSIAGLIMVTISIYLFIMFIYDYLFSGTVRLSQSGLENLLGLFIFVIISLLTYIASTPYLWTDIIQRSITHLSGGVFEFGAILWSEGVWSPYVPGDKLASVTGIINFLLWPIYEPTLLRHFPTCLTLYNGWFMPSFSTLPATLFFIAGLVYLTLKVAKKKLSQIETLTLMWFVITFIGLSLWIPIFRARYVILLIPPIVLIEAMGLSYFLQGMSKKMGYLFAGAALITHVGSTLIVFPEYSLFSLQSLFSNNIGLMLTTVFTLSLLCIIIPRIRSIFRHGVSSRSRHIKSVGDEKH